jgi:hypothetical protein
MSAVEILRTLIASYLITTLGATALAKLKNRPVASAGMLREGVVPAKVTPAVIVTVAIAEFLLATLLMLGVEPVAASLAAAALFVLFAGYRLMVAVRTKTLMCSCAGTIQTDPASPPAVVGATLACLTLAALACILVFLGRPAGYPLNLLAVAAWTAPLASLALGARRGIRRSDIGNLFPAEYFNLGTADISMKR